MDQKEQFELISTLDDADKAIQRHKNSLSRFLFVSRGGKGYSIRQLQKKVGKTIPRKLISALFDGNYGLSPIEENFVTHDIVTKLARVLEVNEKAISRYFRWIVIAHKRLVMLRIRKIPVEEELLNAIKELDYLYALIMEENPFDLENKKLFVYFDTSSVNYEDVAELLSAVNELYQLAGGDELIIKEDLIGTFSSSREGVPA